MPFNMQFFMEDFLREFHLLKKILYKTKNSFGRSLSYRRLSQSLSASKKLLSSYEEKESNRSLIDRAKYLYILAYLSASSSVALGHNLGFSISAMSIISVMYSRSSSLLVSPQSSYVIPPPFMQRNPLQSTSSHQSDSSGSSDEIERIFK